MERQHDKNVEMLPSALRDLFMAARTPKAEEPPRPPAAPDAEKLPRGRPKEKRAYQRTKPFHESERRTPAEAFCVKCRAYSEPTQWKLVTFKNGRPALQGRCPSCGPPVGARWPASSPPEERPCGRRCRRGRPEPGTCSA